MSLIMVLKGVMKAYSPVMVWLCACVYIRMQCTRKFLSTHDGFGHLTSCRLISPYSAQMACDYARLSRDYSAAEIERETERVKINSSNKEKSWHKMKWKHEVCEVRQLEGGWWCGATSFTSTTNMQSNVTNNLVARHKTAKIWAPFSRSALCVCVYVFMSNEKVSSMH